MKKARMVGSGSGGLRAGVSMWVNLLLLLAMVATNLLSFYHLSTTTTSFLPTPHLPTSSIPSHLLTQLSTIRSSISHLTHLHPTTSSSSPTTNTTPELLLYSKISPIATACHHHPELLRQYMTYTPFHPCPPLSPPDLAETLVLRGCHPLPRRRCFSPTTRLPISPPTANPFPTSLPDSSILWNPSSSSSSSGCKSFSCVKASGFDMRAEAARFVAPTKSNLDLSVKQLAAVAAKNGAGPIRLALDVGGGTGTFAARMKVDANCTVITTTMNLGGLPNNEVVALRGLVPLHTPLQQRFPIHDGVVDLVRCGHAVNRWIPARELEFLVYDVDRVLRSGGLLWIDHFLCKNEDLQGVYGPVIWKLQYKVLKWTVGNKTDGGSARNSDVYLTALLQKNGGK